MNKDHDDSQFLRETFQHILQISKGECSIDLEKVHNLEDENKINILGGLKMLHEDLDLYKSELRQNMEAEYKLKLLEKRNQELQQFNYIASHDMKEPMRTIKNFSDLLSKKYADKLDDKANLYLSYISDSSNRMYNLIDGLLDFSQINNHVKRNEVDCNTIIDSILRDIDKVIAENSAQIIYNELPVILGDEIAIRQLFINLISNGIKYKSPDRTPVIKVSYSNKEDTHYFSISDNGMGIKEKYQDQIFELFSRLHINSEIPGTGIGLSICKKVINSLEGRLWVESKFGKGSTFHFTIPK